MPYKPVQMKCACCGKLFVRQPMSRKQIDGTQAVYCSKACFDESQRLPPLTLTCGICGVEFERPRKGTKKGRPTYCSQSCANKASRRRGQPHIVDMAAYWYVGPNWILAADVGKRARRDEKSMRRALWRLTKQGRVECVRDIDGGEYFRRVRTERICAHQGCTTRLSMYNAGDYCYLHREDEVVDPQEWMQVYGGAA